MTHTRSLLRRSGVLLATAGLFSTAMVGLASSANAVETGDAADGTLSWGVSTYLNSANPGRPNPYAEGYGAPATFDSTSRVSNWGAASGGVSDDGSMDVGFAGASVNYAKTSGSWLKIAEPEVEIDSTGNGKLTALVSYGMSTGTNPIPYDDSPSTVIRAAERVDVVNLSGNTSADLAIDADEATWTGLDGAWSPDFVDFVDGDAGASIAPWPYSVTFTSAADRLPQPFTVNVDRAAPSLSHSISGASYSAGLTLAVSGDGFRAVTNPGDAGVYLGLAPAGGLPDVSSQAGMAAFAAADYITPGRMATGAFTSTLHADSAALDPTKSYSLYTWQAHAHSNTTQDTETPVTIDWSALALKPSNVAVSGATSKVYGKTAVVTAKVPAPGTVTLTGLGATQKKTLATAGTASFTVPASLAAGSYTATLVYSGGGDYLGSQASKKLVVAKAATRTAVKVSPKPKAKKAGKATVTVSGAAAGSKVKVVVKKAGKVVKSTTVRVNATGKAVVTLPKAAKGGAFAVTATYAGDKNRKTSTGKTSYKVAKPKKAKKR